MSKSITIRAADSAQAMEEVVRRLGPDALIMSSSRKDGQFEIVAMIEGEMADPNPANSASEPAKMVAAQPATAPAADAPKENAIADRLRQALQASPFASEQQKDIAARKPAQAAPSPKAAPTAQAAPKPDAVDPESPVGMTSPKTFEALLKRRLEEDSVQADLSPDAAAVQAITERAAARKAVEQPAAKPQPQLPSTDTSDPIDTSSAEALFDDTPKPTHKSAIEQAYQADPAIPVAPVAPVAPAAAVAAKTVSAAAIPQDGLEYAPRVTGLGGFDIPTPVLPRNVVEAIHDDLDHYDHSGHLIGLTKAIVSSLLPERVVEPLGAGRFFVAGPDMRQKALAAIRIAIRKLDAGEEKPSFYVMGAEGRADAAFLASKAELLGLDVMLVDETVGRNLPDNVPGSQIVLLPDDHAKARAYVEKFQHDGDKGVFVLPSVFSRELAEQMMQQWAGVELQIFMASSKYAPVSSGLLACLLQFNRQVAWTSDGEEVLDNLLQADEVTLSDWMRAWLPSDVVQACDAPAAPVPATELFSSHALPMQ